MNAGTGKTITGLAEVRQSIRDVITTRPGTRVMRRDYGCGVWDLVDAPVTPHLRIAIVSAVATALARFEPRVQVDRVSVDGAEPGKLTITVDFTYLGEPHQEQVTL